MSRYAFTCHAEPYYLPEQSDQAEPVYAFAYTVTVVNTGEVPAQLISRHWTIVDAGGFREDIQGLGVVGQQPLLKPGEAFEYTSSARLRTPTGTMHGSFFFVAVDGHRFDVPIALFVLEADHPSPADTLGDGSAAPHASTGPAARRVLH